MEMYDLEGGLVKRKILGGATPDPGRRLATQQNPDEWQANPRSSGSGARISNTSRQKDQPCDLPRRMRFQ